MTGALTDLTILVAEEDQATRTFLADNLTADGAHVQTAQSCGEALRRTCTEAPDLIIADVNGDTLRLIEKVAGEVAIIVLTATDVETDRVRKLERGADDVVAKPFGYYELRARAVAVVRRFRAGGRRTLVADAIHVDVAGLDTPPICECAAWQLARQLGDPFDRLVAVTVYRAVGPRTRTR